ncbi:Hybrid PKS-NRPS synthetase [Alternaria gaisen]|uniref:Hybrid PKS-NRPS synthetase n=1 Tax=Alternaria gaisen TaxID=167740 RepID=A0ACB6F6P0_9PLEO|nr:Hybrid PKS-NRPS synthetase [Alternaria gaisen]
MNGKSRDNGHDGKRQPVVPAEPIAIVGTAMRLPGDAANPSKLWQLLRNPPSDLSRRPPSERFSSAGFFHEDPEHHGTSNSEQSYFLREDIRAFDAAFFSIAPREVEAIDPQHRLLLEVVYEALEAAGIPLEKTQGSDTAVYVGQMSNDYWDHLLRDLDSIPKYMATGTARSVTANRLSYFFDWHGPSMTIDTACSSSMVALHEAVQVLRSGRADMAVAAGCHLVLGPESYVIESKLRMISPTGTCKMWDAGADGYARAEGCAALILKTLSSALRDGDPIAALIRETGVNQDGRTRGITMPSAEAQAALIRETYLRAGLDPTHPRDQPQFFEAHGTGTQAGDPVEAEAIHLAFFNDDVAHKGTREKKEHVKLLVGSIKTVVGHLEATAGLAGILKGIAAMNHRMIPPNLWFRTLNHRIVPFYRDFRVPTVLEEWPTTGFDGTLRCSVNSFGFGGTNAHTILESYEPQLVTATQMPREISFITPLTFSAASAASLVDVVDSYRRHLASKQDISLSDLAFTLQSRRSALPYRIAFSGTDITSLIKQMSESVDSVKGTANVSIGTLNQQGKLEGGSPKLLGVFTGQGAQWPGMGRELLKSSKVFSDAIIKMEDSLATLPDPPSWSLVDQFKAKASPSSSEEATVAQPVSLALQIGLVDLLRASGVEFDSVVAHSSGEIAAAYTTGLISAHDAIRIAYYRGKYSALATEGGGMMAVGMSFAEAKAFCDQEQLRDRVTAAASNSPKSTTLSGRLSALKEAASLLGSTFHRFLKVDKAYHSDAMLPCCEPFQAILERCDIKVHKPNDVLWISSVREGQQPRSFADLLSGPYWVETLHKPVLFSQALTRVLQMRSFDAALEIGPHPALRGPSLQTHADISLEKGTVLLYKGVLERFKHDGEAFSSCLGFLWQHFGWAHFEAYRSTSLSTDVPRVLDQLPTYPWNHESLYWTESSHSYRFRYREAYHPLLGFRSVDSHAMELRWKNVWSLREMPWLKGHVVQGQAVIPGVSYVTLALEAAAALGREGQEATRIELHDINIHRAIIMEEDEYSGTNVFVSVSRQNSDASCTRATFNIYASTNHEKEPFHVCSGDILLSHFAKDSRIQALGEFDVSTVYKDMSPVEPSLFYSEMKEVGLCWKEPFLSDSMYRSHHRSVLSATRLTADAHDGQLLLSPVLLDIGFQGALVGFASPGDGRLWNPYLPTHIDRCTFDLENLKLNKPCYDEVYFSSAVMGSTLPDLSTTATFTCDVYGFYAIDGNPFVQVEGLKFSCMYPAQETNDREMFANETWMPASPLDMELQPHDAQKHMGNLGAVVENLSHCNPRMKILHINDGESLVVPILESLRGAFARLDIADSSQSPALRHVEEVKELFPKDSKRIWSSDLNLTQLTSSPAIAENSYDLIICAQTIETGDDVESRCSKLRKLLKLGGSIILSTSPGTSCTLPLQRCGFTGVELELSVGAESRLILTRAKDDTSKTLETPLDALDACTGEVIVIGGHQPEIQAIVDTFQKDLAGKLSKTTLVESLSDLESCGVPTDATVLCLADLHDDTLRNLTEGTLGGMKLLFETAKRVLWVTQGRRNQNPFASMMVGLGRSIISESPLLNLQFLDIEDPLSDPVTHKTISECFIKLISLTTTSDSNVVRSWKQEPEMVLSQGKLLIPRIRPLTALNDRLNCQNRIIKKPLVAGDGTSVELTRSGAFYAAREYDDYSAGRRITISHSVSLPIELPGQMKGYLGLGTMSSGERVVVISPNNRNIQSAEECAFAVHFQPRGNEADTLALIASAIFIRVAWEHTSDYVVLHQPSQSVYRLGTQMAGDAKLKLCFSVSGRNDLEKHANVVSIPSMATQQSLKRLMPGQVGAFIDVPGLAGAGDRVSADRMIRAMSTTCKIFHPATAAASSQSEGIDVRLSFNWKKAYRILVQSVEDVAKFGNSQMLAENQPVERIGIAEIPETPFSYDVARIIDWTKDSRVKVNIQPKSPTKHFSPNKTYLLVGLTGDLGRSLAQWMIRCGAQHIVLTSRSPRVPDSWLQACREISPQAQVRVFKMDVTDEADVRNICHAICKSMPPIGGVANAAMVMDDCLFHKLQLASFNRVVEPKVVGSMILDKIFHDVDLDFFIMFSSISCIVGNRGQSSYSAANLAETTIASGRRSRGLSASTLALGMVVGVGYVARANLATEAIKDNVRMQNGIPLGETDVHTAFFEAMLLGKESSRLIPELITGLESIGSEDVELPLWHENPRFSHLSLLEGLDDVSLDSKKSSQGKVSVREQLRQSTMPQEPFEILSGSLKQKLKVTLKIDKQEISDEVALVQMGIDSLSAVEIRSWFAKEVGVDLPVLKILNGASIRGLCLEAIGQWKK